MSNACFTLGEELHSLGFIMMITEAFYWRSEHHCPSAHMWWRSLCWEKATTIQTLPHYMTVQSQQLLLRGLLLQTKPFSIKQLTSFFHDRKLGKGFVKWNIVIILGRTQFMRCMPMVKLSDHVVCVALVDFKMGCFSLRCMGTSLENTPA